MTTFLIVLHIMVCLVLVTVVLLQRGKGADMGAAFGGGGSNTVFGSRGAGNFLTKITSICAATFMITSFSLALVNMQSKEQKVFDSDAQANPDAPLSGAEATPETTGEAQTKPVSPDTLEEIPSPSSNEGAEANPNSGEAAPTQP